MKSCPARGRLFFFANTGSIQEFHTLFSSIKQREKKNFTGICGRMSDTTLFLCKRFSLSRECPYHLPEIE